jgi:glycosyltransferase involved in cell wall biosynthesis
MSADPASGGPVGGRAGRRPRLLYLTQWFEPEPTFKGLGFAKSLQERGFDVDVLTGFPNYPSGKLHPGYKIRPIRREVIEGLRVTRVALYPSHDNSGFRRSLNYLSFFASACLYLLFRRRRYDAIYVYHPPITAGLAPAVAGLVRRTPLILEVQDLWPDAISSSGMAGPRLERMLGPLCNFVYRRSAKIVVQSHGMGRKLVERGVPAAKLETIINWAREDWISPSGTADLAPFGFEGRFTFVYGGAMGAHQSLASVMHAAQKAAQTCPQIRVVLIGTGVQYEELRALAASMEGDLVRVLPSIPGDQIADVFVAADVLLVQLAPEPVYEVTIPSKTQFYLAMGRPILAALAGEAAGILRESGAALVVPPGDVDALAAAMIEFATMDPERRRAMGEAGRTYYFHRLSYDQGLARTTALIRAQVEG